MTKTIPAPVSSAQRAHLINMQPIAPSQIRQAGFVTRALALIIDIVIVMGGAVVFSALVSLIFSFFGITGGDTQLTFPPEGILEILKFIIIGVAALAVFLFVPAYFVFFWVVVGATPGKQLLGLRVIRTDATPVGWIRGILRYIGYFISAICLFLGFLWVLVDGRRQGWHDKMVDTYVVYAWDLPEE